LAFAVDTLAEAMTLFQTLYPYALAGSNLAIGWVSYTALGPDTALPFLAVGLLVLLAVLGRTAARYRAALTAATQP